MTQTTKNTLAALIGAPVELSVGSIKISVKPLGWYESLSVIDAILPALGSMPGPPAAGGDVGDIGPWLGWLQMHRDAVVTFCHLASGQAEEDVAAIGPVELLDLVFGLIEVNADFFTRNLHAEGLNLGERVRALVNTISGTSQTSSSGSSATATPGPT